MVTISGLYAVTPQTGDSAIEQDRLFASVALALEGGTSTLQYRCKNAAFTFRLLQAQRLKMLCRQHGVSFIVNDDVELAAQVHADGVHLGREDLAISAARARLGRSTLIGASCYADLARADAAVNAGADYLAFGSFFPSSVKPDAVRASLDVLRQARRRWQVPLVAIGGITRENAPQVIEAGADAVAVITAVFSAADPRESARSIARLFDHNVQGEHPNVTN
jgi:thiamine-phosphate pyrophosphorylase